VPAQRSQSIQYINVLRILAIYAVVTAHVAIWLTMATQPFVFNWWLGCWLFYLGHFSIPVFVMISGALLLDDARRESAGQFYRRRMVRVGIPLVVWSVAYLLVRRFIDHESLSAGSIVRLILTGDPYYHLWFLYMIFGLYLITPALRTFVRCASQGQRWLVIVLGLVLANAYFQTDVLLWNNQRSIFTMFVPFIAFYLCGYEVRRIDPKKVPSRYLVLAVVLSALYFAAFSGVFLERAGGVGVRYLFDFFSLPMVFLSIGIFWAAYLWDDEHSRWASGLQGVRRSRWTTAVEWVSSTVMGIYVLHPLVLDGLRRALSGESGDDRFIAGVIVVPLITVSACYLITSLLMNIPLLKRTVC
jgi:surface polysaccharide O-acyltransferase-like enzyme